jgi:hypothetical protein
MCRRAQFLRSVSTMTGLPLRSSTGLGLQQLNGFHDSTECVRRFHAQGVEQFRRLRFKFSANVNIG